MRGAEVGNILSAGRAGRISRSSTGPAHCFSPLTALRECRIRHHPGRRYWCPAPSLVRSAVQCAFSSNYLCFPI